MQTLLSTEPGSIQQLCTFSSLFQKCVITSFLHSPGFPYFHLSFPQTLPSPNVFTITFSIFFTYTSSVCLFNWDTSPLEPTILLLQHDGLAWSPMRSCHLGACLARQSRDGKSLFLKSTLKLAFICICRHTLNNNKTLPSPPQTLCLRKILRWSILVAPPANAIKATE